MNNYQPKIWLVINPDNVPLMAFESETEAMEYKYQLGFLYTLMCVDVRKAYN